jgi:hypothetical protein
MTSMNQISTLRFIFAAIFLKLFANVAVIMASLYLVHGLRKRPSKLLYQRLSASLFTQQQLFFKSTNWSIYMIKRYSGPPWTSHSLAVCLVLSYFASLENILGLQPGDAELGDFLFDSARGGVYHIKMESAHATLAESCLRILLHQLILRTTSIRKAAGIRS